MLIEVVRKAAAEVPDQPVVISSSGSETYSDCLRRSEAVARGLLERGIDRFGCALAAPEDVVVVAVASSASGSDACIYPNDVDAAGLSGLAERFSHSVVVTDGAIELQGCETVSLEELASTTTEPLAIPERTPVLVLTTGTTGEPKGARHDWSQLVKAVQSRDPEPGKRWLLAYNLRDFSSALRDLQTYLQLSPKGNLDTEEREEHEQIWEHVKALRRRVASLN